MLQFREKILDQVAHLVEMGIKLRVRLAAVGFPGNYGIHFFGSRLLSDCLRVVSLVSNQIIGFDYLFNDLWRGFGVVDFTPSDFKIDRISMRIGAYVKFGGRSPARSSNGSLMPSPSSARMLVSADVSSVDENPFRINFAS